MPQVGWRPLATRTLLFALILATPLWAGSGGTSGTPLERGLAAVAREHAFSLTRWEVVALGERAARAVQPAWTPGRDEAADRRVVLRYAELTAELERLRGERDQVEATEPAATRAARVTALGERAAALTSERQALAPAVESVVGWQIEQALAERGIELGRLELTPAVDFPYVAVGVNPWVAFRLGHTPDLLLVARRDRVELAGSILLEAGLGYADVDRLEAAADRLNVASLVTPIGGLAAYPSMVGATSSVRYALQTVSHEWVHHYLAFRPLGLAYFRGYAERSINETVADVVAEELAAAVYQRHYAPPAEAQPAPPARPPATAPAQPSFGDLMRAIRREVEAYLARGDVAGAEVYMAEQRRELAQQGYYVRRLNTAYLSFFGSYAGQGNPYEARLRQLRQRSGSLRAFLLTVAALGSAADFERLAGEAS